MTTEEIDFCVTVTMWVVGLMVTAIVLSWLFSTNIVLYLLQGAFDYVIGHFWF